MLNIDNIPILSIDLPDAQEWQDRIGLSKLYFESQGINNIYWITGIHGEAFGIKAARPYQRDVPDTDWHLEPRTVGGYLSAYMLFSIAYSHSEWSHFIYLEDDIRFHEGWKERLTNALNDVPEDFDWLFLSHCCTEGRETKHIKGEVFEVKYPMAGGFSIVARKALPTIINGLRDACTPTDITLFDRVFKDLKVYTLLPRLAEQDKTFLPR